LPATLLLHTDVAPLLHMDDVLLFACLATGHHPACELHAV
jgi:hypothetical protein